MIIFPAIDVKDGKVVRLSEGDYEKVTVYGENPVETAKKFRDSGARAMHVVDLDGARDGRLVNFDIIRSIVSATDMFVEVGGGIRDEERIRQYLGAGAGRVILGTAVVENPDFVKRIVEKYGDKIAAGVDAKNGYVAIKGWETVTRIPAFDFCAELVEGGIKNVIYTDISRDGMLRGANLGAYGRLMDITGLNVTASGGISGVGEIIALKRLGVAGAIVGKALYEGKLSLEDALKAAED